MSYSDEEMREMSKVAQTTAYCGTLKMACQTLKVSGEMLEQVINERDAARKFGAWQLEGLNMACQTLNVSGEMLEQVINERDALQARLDLIKKTLDEDFTPITELKAGDDVYSVQAVNYAHRIAAGHMSEEGE